jgi:hypothetical protein
MSEEIDWSCVSLRGVEVFVPAECHQAVLRSSQVKMVLLLGWASVFFNQCLDLEQKYSYTL